MDENMYVTVTGFANYYAKKPFAIGNVLVCIKEPSNRHDSEAISVKLPIIGKVGICFKFSVHYGRGNCQRRQNL